MGLVTLPPSCADGLEVCEPEPLGTLRVCPDLSMDCCTKIYGGYPVICNWRARRDSGGLAPHMLNSGSRKRLVLKATSLSKVFHVSEVKK